MQRVVISIELRVICLNMILLALNKHELKNHIIEEIVFLFINHRIQFIKVISSNKQNHKMAFVQNYLHRLKNNLQPSLQNYQFHTSWFSRKVFLLHTLKYLIHATNQLKQNQQTEKGINLNQLKQIKEEDSTLFIVNEMSQQYQRIIREKTVKELDSYDIFKIVFATFKSEIISACIALFISGILLLAFSFLIFYLFEAVKNQNYVLSYIYCLALVLFWYSAQISSHIGLNMAYMLVLKIKSALSMLIYCKISSLTSIVIRTQYADTLAQLIRKDFSVLDSKIAQSVYVIPFFVILLGSTFIVISKIGILGILSLVIIGLTITLTYFIEKINKNYLQIYMNLKDKRKILQKDIILGIKDVKMYGWQLAFNKILIKIRKQQNENLRKLGLGRSLIRMLNRSIIFLLSLAIFVLGRNFSIKFNVSFIFTTLITMLILSSYISFISQNIELYQSLQAIFDRFASLLNIDDYFPLSLESEKQQTNNNHEKILEKRKKNEQRKSSEKKKIQFSEYSACISEKTQEIQVLHKINFLFKSQHLYGITGKQNSGKSILFSAILGELPKHTGQLSVKGSISYVQQNPVIFSDTIQNNITLGRKFVFGQYSKALKLSFFGTDIDTFLEKDQTMVGQKGTILSKCRKKRLILARALYSNSDIYLLDDPFDGVDPKIATQIFRQCIKPLSQHKIVILVSRQLSFIEECDEILIIQNGMIQREGPFEEMKNQVRQILNESQNILDEEESSTDSFSISRRSSNIQTSTQLSRSAPENLVQQVKEKEEKGRFKTLSSFFFNNSINYFLVPFTLFLFLLSQIILAIFYRILANFDEVVNGGPTLFNLNTGNYWTILAFILLTFIILLYIEYFLISICIINSSSKFYQQLIQNIMLSPFSYFDKIPHGYIINTLSKDIQVIDTQLPRAITDSIEGFFIVLVALTNIIQIDIFLIIPTVIIVGLVIWLSKYSKPACVACRQLFFSQKNLFLHHFVETINGLTQIRIFNQKIIRMQSFSQMLDKIIKSWLGFEMVMRGFYLYTSLTINMLICFGIFLGVLSTTTDKIGLFGGTIVYLISISYYLSLVLKQVVETESIMQSIQKLKQFLKIKTEKQLRTVYDWEIGLEEEVQAALNNQYCHQIWPNQPSLLFNNVSIRHQNDFTFVLKKLSFQARKGEKVGILGSVESGKREIISALFRIFQPEFGSVFEIGGHDALKMGLHSLRQHISVIPQVPFLFRGTVRQNIDPFETVETQRIWDVLKESGLDEHVKNFDQDLYTELSDKTEYFSAGQKKLLCLARALLRRNKFLVLDESTSNLDMKTDTFIQRVIREKFSGTTIITIAHRLSTIADYDKVIIMRQGEIVEQGAPWRLLEKRGVFYDMIQASKNAEEIKNKIRQGYKGL